MIVNGCYEGVADDGQTKLVLRIDVNGLPGSCSSVNRVSADVFAVSQLGEDTWDDYQKSWRVEAPSLISSEDPVAIGGTATSSIPGESLTVDVQVPLQAQPGPAVVTVRKSDGTSSVYSCAWVGDAFREVTLEEDVCKSVTSHPVPRVEISNGPGAQPRIITRESAYADAGVRLSFASQTQKTVGVVDDVTSTGPGLIWTDDELNHALADHFQGGTSKGPQWSLWALLAGAHNDPTTAGVMFDRTSGPAGTAGSPSRQGFAVFRQHEWFKDLANDDPMAQRRYLLAWVHEMGHAFNLLHTEFTSVPIDVPTWMVDEIDFERRTQRLFWNDFQFRFHETELVHLRHGYLRTVAIGGDDFFGESYLKSSPSERSLSEQELIFSRPMTPGPLELLLRSCGYFEFREPLTVEARVRNRLENEYLPIRSSLHPEEGGLTFYILRPDRRLVKYEPVIRKLTNWQMRTLAPSGDTGRDRYSAAIPLTFGRDGFYFDTPGEYRIRAVYSLGKGVVLSNVLRVRVGYPSPEADRKAQDFFTDDVGWALYLEGSQSPYLSKGIDVLHDLAAQPTPLGVQVASSIVRGVGAPFYQTDKKVVTRKEGRPGDALKLTDQAYRFFHELPAYYPNVVDQKQFNLAYARLVRRRAQYYPMTANPGAAEIEKNTLLSDLASRDVHQPVLDGLRSELGLLVAASMP